MSKVKIMLNSAGVRELLHEAGGICEERAAAMASACGDGYTAETRKYPERTGAAVYAGTPKAMADNLKHNTLLKAVRR